MKYRALVEVFEFESGMVLLMMCSTYKLCSQHQLVFFFDFPESIKDSFKEESWCHEKFVRSFPSSGDIC